MAAQGGDEGLCFPGAERSMGAVTLTFWRPTTSFGQLGIGGGFVQKDKAWQSFGKEWPPPVDPQISTLLHINALLLISNQTFFYC